MADKKKSGKQKGFADFLFSTRANRPTGAGARRDDKLRKAEEKALGLDKKKKK